MELSKIIDELEKYDALSEANGVSRRFLELIRSDSPLDEITIFGNREGLVHLALCCLSLADDSTPGAHQHFDRNSVFERVDVSLVVARKSAAWDDIDTN